MFDQIDPRSPTPLYAQIAARLKLAVAAGELRPGEALPSVRQLAARLRVNPATVVQAYPVFRNKRSANFSRAQIFLCPLKWACPSGSRKSKT